MTFNAAPFIFNLPYNQSSNYWIAIFLEKKNELAHTHLISLGLQPIAGIEAAYIISVSHPWVDMWQQVSTLLSDQQIAYEVSLVPGENKPNQDELTYARKKPEMISHLVESLWLGDAMLQDQIVSYMQPVLDKRGKVFGYESFARLETKGSPVSGNTIIETSKYLNAEYALDRYLHVKAIKSFVESDLQGFLFINFLPGFIHRPEKYLAGLTECAKYYGMPAKQIVLDITQSDIPQDTKHLKAIFEYCRSQQYSLSLDDISSVLMAKKILEVISPDFIKLDIELVRNSNGNAERYTITELVDIAHAAGITVLAEGVETDAIYRELLKSGVDFFQGYLFSPPVAISALKKLFG